MIARGFLGSFHDYRMIEPENNDTMAQAIVDTIREPLLVLDRDLRVIVANRYFYSKFQIEPQFTQGRMLASLAQGQWNIPALHALLQKIGADDEALEDYEVELDFPQLGRRILLMSGRKLVHAHDAAVNILVSLTDITELRQAERKRDELLRQKDILLEEIKHRVANSLAIIASILLMKARAVSSPETRGHLEDAHKRVISVATVQRHLYPSEMGFSIELSGYLEQLCASLAASMINGDFCAIKTEIARISVSSQTAVSIGLIVTELVINALKHAFPASQTGCAIHVSYEINGSDWKLRVSDNGASAQTASWPPAKVGLGTTIVNALAEQLDARVDIVSGPSGTSVSVMHSTFRPLAQAA